MWCVGMGCTYFIAFQLDWEDESLLSATRSAEEEEEDLDGSTASAWDLRRKLLNQHTQRHREREREREERMRKQQ